MEVKICVFWISMFATANIGKSVKLDTVTDQLSHYDKNVKPNHQVKVELGFYLVNLHLCPHKQVFTTNGWISMKWIDERLASLVTGNGSIRVPHDHIWIPDIVPVHASEGVASNFVPWEKSGPRAVIMKGGKVFYIPPVTIKTWCSVNYGNWPFGEQSCPMKVGSWTYMQKDIDITNGNCSRNCLDISEFQNNQVEIKRTSAYKVVKNFDGYGLWPFLSVNIKFQFKEKFEKGKLHCSLKPDMTDILNHCNTDNDCPCGLNHCHLLDLVHPDGRGICTPGETFCVNDIDCKKVGNINIGKLGVSCQNSKCEYEDAIMIA